MIVFKGGTFYSIRAHKPITITAEGIAGIIVNNDCFQDFSKDFLLISERGTSETKNNFPPDILE